MKKITVGLGALALLLGTVGVSAGTALAYRGDSSVNGPQYSAERHVLMEKAFENNDYDAWKNLMQGKGRVTQVITKDNFAKFAEMHELMAQGRMAEAGQIRQELGLGLQNGLGRGSCAGGGANR